MSFTIEIWVLGLRVRKLPLANENIETSEESDSGSKKKGRNSVNNNNNQGNGKLLMYF